MKKRKNSFFTPLSEVLQSLLKTRSTSPFRSHIFCEELKTHWKEVLKKPLYSKNSCPSFYKNQTLSIFVSSSSLVQEMSFCKEELIQEINHFSQSHLDFHDPPVQSIVLKLNSALSEEAQTKKREL